MARARCLMAEQRCLMAGERGLWLNKSNSLLPCDFVIQLFYSARRRVSVTVKIVLQHIFRLNARLADVKMTSHVTSF